MSDELTPKKLTPKELVILAAAAAGETGPETGRRLWLTPETIKWHRANLMRKLGVHTMAAAVWAGRDLLTPDALGYPDR